jgi:hypothetical protein
MRTGLLLSGLFILILANLLALWGFQGKITREGFASYFLENAAEMDAKPIGPFDNVRLSTGNGVSQWRYNHPDEPLEQNYPKFNLGPDNLFMFKDNKCKPECCGASYACDGGCVCTTPDQRNFINTRGGNRTVEDGF